MRPLKPSKTFPIPQITILPSKSDNFPDPLRLLWWKQLVKEEDISSFSECHSRVSFPSPSSEPSTQLPVYVYDILPSLNSSGYMFRTCAIIVPVPCLFPSLYSPM